MSDYGVAGGGGRPGRSGLRRLLPSWRLVTGLVLTVLVLLLGGFFLGYALVGIPDPNKEAVAQSNVYYYADGKTELARDGAVNRQNVSLAQVSKTTQYAVLSAEDRNFYHESAVNPKSMLRAAWNSATGKGLQSGSTITQQYVKNYYLNQDQTASRKIKEFFIAIKLDRNVSKDDIFAGYLNTSYYGRNAFGIQAAAKAYFDTDAADLDTAQGAYLATLLNAPSEYDLAAHPESAHAAKARWNYVLDGMVKEHWLSPAKRAAVRFPAIGKPKPLASKAGQRGYIIEAVNEYLDENHIVDSESLQRGGYRIVTSIQKGREDAFVAAAQANVYDKLGDNAADAYVRAGGASIDPATGQVVALYGGIDYTKQYVSSATNATYPPGSTFKPVILASALQNESETQDGRRITPKTVYDGTNKREVVGPDGPTGYRPENEDQDTFPRINVTRAMDKSVNAVYAQMAQDVGTGKVVDTAHALGLPDSVKIPTTPAMALGSFGASPLQMAQVYATLANHGKQVPYTLVRKVSKDGDDLPLPDRNPRQAVSAEVADTVTQVLRSVVESQGATATVAQRSGWPSAAKTGTAEKDIAAWFAGYTPKLATVVDVIGMNPVDGSQEPLYDAMNTPRINGGGPPGAVWADYTAKALRGVPVTDFDLDVTKALPPSPTQTDSPAPDDTATSEPPGDSQPPTSEQPPASGSPTTPPPTEPTGPASGSPTATPPTGPTLDPIGGLTNGGADSSGGAGGGIEPGPGATDNADDTANAPGGR